MGNIAESAEGRIPCEEGLYGDAVSLRPAP